MNGNEGMYLWEEMNGLGEYLLQQLKEATLLRVEASIMCCSQIDSFKFIFQYLSSEPSRDISIILSSNGLQGKTNHFLYSNSLRRDAELNKLSSRSLQIGSAVDGRLSLPMSRRWPCTLQHPWFMAGTSTARGSTQR